MLFLRCSQNFAKESLFILEQTAQGREHIVATSFNVPIRAGCALGASADAGKTTCYRAMQTRRLEDRIRGLTEHALVAHEHELSIIMAELRSCLLEHANRLREKTLQRLTCGEFRERRTSETGSSGGD